MATWYVSDIPSAKDLSMNYPEIADPAQDPSPFTTPLQQQSIPVRANAALAAALPDLGSTLVDGVVVDVANWNMPHFDSASGNIEWLMALMEGSEHLDVRHDAIALGAVIGLAHTTHTVEAADLPIQPVPVPPLLSPTALFALPEGPMDLDSFNEAVPSPTVDAFF